jgi:uncharacterized membrane protein
MNVLAEKADEPGAGIHGPDGDEVAATGDREQAYSLGRVLAISDGVFAFALTLLVVQLAIPTAGARESLMSRLLEQGPTYFSYILSFGVIALTWSGHHDTFKYVRRVDGRLIALNFGALLLIAILPFPTAVLGHNGSDPAAALLYAITIALSGASSAAIWWYATHLRRLVDIDIPRRIVRRRFYLSLSVPVVFLISIPIVLWRPAVAEICWAVLWTVFFVVLRRYVDRLA